MLRFQNYPVEMVWRLIDVFLIIIIIYESRYLIVLFKGVSGRSSVALCLDT